MFKILIDADACPVKDEVYKVAIRNNLNVVVVSNGGIRPYKHPLIKNVYVDQGFNEADEYILDLLSEKDHFCSFSKSWHIILIFILFFKFFKNSLFLSTEYIKKILENSIECLPLPQAISISVPPG